MDKWFSQGLAQLKQLWSSLTRSQKLRIGMIFLFSLAAIGLLLAYTMRVEYAPVFTKLSAQEAGEVQNKLTELKITSKATSAADGTITVSVPTSRAMDAKLQLASAGLPKGAVTGLEVYGNPSWTTTTAQAKVQYQRSLQGELERTFESIEGVSKAKVMLTLPDQPVFLKDKRDPSAAVILVLKPGVRLDKSQINGVIDLAAHSVEGLKPENITLVDGNGTPLHVNGTGAVSGDAGAQRSQEQAIRADLENSVQSLLEQMFGLGNVTTRINVAMNFDQTNRQTKTYQPPIPGSKEGLILSIRKASENVKGQNQGAAPGTTSNIPGSAGVSPQNNGQSGSSESTNDEINYLVNEIVETVTMAPQIKDLSAAVAVNTKKVKFDDQLAQTVKGIVASATGAKQEQITVAGLDFVPPIDQKEIDAAQAQEQRQKLFTLVSIPAVVLLVGFILFKFYGAWQRRKREEEERARLPAAVPEVKLPERQLTHEERKRLKVQEELGKIARDKPEDFAQLLKAWLDEE